MFISTYSTYINTNTSEKTHKQTQNRLQENQESFNKELSKNSVVKSTVSKNLPIDYVHNNQSLKTQQKLQEQTLTPNEIKLKKKKDMKSAGTAYKEGATMFPLYNKPKTTFSQTVKSTKELPQEIQNLKEETLRHVMVNTYLENDRYYQITA